MDCPSSVYYLEMEKIIKIEELGLTIGAEHFPKLFKLAKDNYKRLLTILKSVKRHSRGLDWKEILRILEKNEPVEIMGEMVDALSFPMVYFTFRENRERFLKCFEEVVRLLWSGEKRQALEALEAHFEEEAV